MADSTVPTAESQIGIHNTCPIPSIESLYNLQLYVLLPGRGVAGPGAVQPPPGVNSGGLPQHRQDLLHDSIRRAAEVVTAGKAQGLGHAGG